MDIDIGRLVDVRPGLVWAATADNARNYLNQRWRTFCGSTPEAVVTGDWTSPIHPDDLRQVQACWQATLASGEAGEVEARLRRRDGEHRRFNIRTSAVRDAAGGVVCWCGIATEIEGEEPQSAVPRDGAPQGTSGELLGVRALSHIGLFTVDLLRDEHVWSEELRRIWEVEPDEAITQAEILRRIHPDDQERCVAEYARVLEGAETHFALRLVTPSGKVKYVRSTSRVLTYVNGGPVVVGAYQDETERVLAEQALRANQAELLRTNRELKDAQALSHVGSFTSNLRTEDHAWSEEMRRIWEFEDGSPISHAMILGRIHPDDRAGFEAEYARVFEGSDSDFSFRIVTPSGKGKHLRSVARVVESAPAGPLVVGTQQDETESVLAAEALKASEREVRRVNRVLLDAQGLSRVGSYTANLSTGEYGASEELRRIWEFDAEAEISFDEILRRIHPDDRAAFEADYARTLAGSNSDFSFRIVTPSGQVRHLRSVSRILEYDDAGPVVIGIQQDETERVLAAEALRLSEAELNRARADLAHASRVMALGAITASIAHEVNQPLAGIVTNAATCLRMLAADPPNLEGAMACAQRMVRDGNRAAEVIQRLRALFANKPPAFEAVDLNEAAAEVLALSAAELRAAKVSVRSKFEPALPVVRGDRIQLQQVILNLVLNATDAMSCVDDRARELAITTASETDGVRLSVCDAGVGVDPSGVERLFEAFHTTKETGMGIGLAVSRSIIEIHEGRLWAEPNAGPGATFAFTLPAASPAVRLQS